MPGGIGPLQAGEKHPTMELMKKDPKDLTDEELWKAITWRIKPRPEEEEGYYRHSQFLPEILKRYCGGDRGNGLILMALPGWPKDIAEKIGLTEEEIEKKLEVLGDKAVAWKTSKGWFLPRSMVGQLHDGALCVPKYWKEYGEDFPALWEAFSMNEYYLDPNYGYGNLRKGMTDKEKRSRVIPDRRALAEGLELAPWEDLKVVFDMMDQEDKLGAKHCDCQRTRIGSRQDEDGWHCVISGRVMDYWMGKEKDDKGNMPIKKYTSEEALGAADKWHDMGIVSILPNGKDLSEMRTFCNCHVNFCDGMIPGLLRGISLREQRAPSRYLMSVKSTDTCKTCQSCVKQCFWGAAQLKRVDPPGGKWDEDAVYKAWVDPDMCVGCGNCALVCPEKNRELILIRDADFVPEKPKSFGM
ncbi:DUF362 domain-containing protein [Chloroflexota bacterium]